MLNKVYIHKTLKAEEPANAASIDKEHDGIDAVIGMKTVGNSFMIFINKVLNSYNLLIVTIYLVTSVAYISISLRFFWCT
jgi:hypothetical protein